MSFRVELFTLFPDMFPGTLGQSLAGKALEAGIWSLDTVDIRDYAPSRRVDDTPYGGGPGMVLRADIISAAIETNHQPDLPLVLLTPRGKPFHQSDAERFAKGPGLGLVAGRYEGIDERFSTHHRPEPFSIGDFVLSGGEIAAMAMLDAMIRLLPGVMGCGLSATQESFADGLLEYPHYTRPPIWQGLAVPDVLVSGDHGAIVRFRREQAELATCENRPDLWSHYQKCQVLQARTQPFPHEPPDTKDKPKASKVCR